MYYSFLDDGDGEVLNEKKDSSLYGSYLGLRFPASDIPKIARKLFSLVYGGYIAHSRMNMIDSLKFKIDKAKNIVLTNFFSLAAWLMFEFASDGVSILSDEKMIHEGNTLKDDSLEEIEQWFLSQKEYILSVTNLNSTLDLQIFTEVAGFIAIKINTIKFGKIRIYICRKEHIQEIEWGGNPEKPITRSEHGIAPRHSFEKWIEKRMGSCRNWEHKDKLLAIKILEIFKGM